VLESFKVLLLLDEDLAKRCLNNETRLESADKEIWDTLEFLFSKNSIKDCIVG